MALQNNVPNHEQISIQDSFQTQVSWLQRLIHTESHHLVQFWATFGWSQFQYVYCSVSLLFLDTLDHNPSNHTVEKSIFAYERKYQKRLLSLLVMLFL